MRSKVAERILAKTPEDVRIFVRLYADIVVRVTQLLKEKGYTQKQLADKLDKTPSEIHKWLSKEHNFTLRSIAKLEAELGETILNVPVMKKSKVFISTKGRTVQMNVHRNEFINMKTEYVTNWKATEETNYLANVG